MIKQLVMTFIMITTLGCSKGPLFDLANINDKFDGVSYNNKIDILWVVDSTSSMDEDRVKIIGQIGRMIDTMDSKKLDYRMAVTTMDMTDDADPRYSGGRLVGNPHVISSSSNNKVGIFTSMLSVPTSTTTLERGLGAMRAALSDENRYGVNSGFLRDGALLAVIFVADENDWSTNLDYVAFLDNLKAPLENGNKGWVSNFIGVIDSSCESSRGNSVVGRKFIDMAEASNGSVNDICDATLTNAVSNIQRTIISVVTEYKLNAIPLVETIKVVIGGVEIPQDSENGWSYDSEKNTVSFHGVAIPSADMKVEVTFKPKELD